MLVNFCPRKTFFSAIFNSHFRENPCFPDEFQALLYSTRPTLALFDGQHQGKVLRDRAECVWALQCLQCHLARKKTNTGTCQIRSSSSCSSDGNSSLFDEGGSASQVPQASIELAGYKSVIWPDSLSERLVDGALQ